MGKDGEENGELGRTSCKLYWSDLRGKKKSRKIERLKARVGKGVVEKEGEVLEMARHWEELGRERGDSTTLIVGSLCNFAEIFRRVVNFLRSLGSI